MSDLPHALSGRSGECATLDGLLEGVGGGRSAALVVRGEAGAGKTALLRYAIDSAAGLRVLSAVGVESEMELAFAALHQLCVPVLDRLEHLPSPQRDALGIAFALTEGPAPDRFLVGLAVLSLLSEAAGDRPLLCVVDDAQWLDRASAQTLAFVARRLLAESVLIVFAAREPVADFRGLPELVVGGLSERDARELLAQVVRWPLDERVQERIVAETRGNPLALLELPRGLSMTELAGGFGLPEADPDAMLLSGRIEDSFLRRLGDLPAPTRLLLLIAAAEPTGDPVLLWQAAARLGVSVDAAGDAEVPGLVEFGARVRFRHPLVRSAVYRSASAEDRQRAHRILAEATDPQVDPDRRAWHLAQAAANADEDLAAELERSAGRAQARGGLAAAAAFLERSAVLTTDPGLRATRALAAAQAAYRAGAPDEAFELLARAEAGPPDELLRARASLLRGQMAFASGHSADASALLLATAHRFEQVDPRLARETYLDALAAATFVGRLAKLAGLPEVATAGRAAPAAPRAPRAPDLLLDGLAVLITDGYQAGAPALKRAVRAFRRGDVAAEDELRWFFVACHSTHDLWDDDSWSELSARYLQLARNVGALGVLPIALAQRVGLHLHTGEFTAAAALVEETAAITEATGNDLPAYSAMALAGWRGRTEAVELIEAIKRHAAARDEGMGLSMAYYTSAVLHNGLGRYEDALAAADQASAYPRERGFANWGLAELAEAAARSGETRRANDAVERLARTTGPCGTPWARGIEARSRALVSDGEEAELLYQEAIDQLGRSLGAVALARARLVYGEWLRRKGRRVDARDQLRTAHQVLVSAGAEAFAERARRELIATGETVRKRSQDVDAHELTPQEAHIARLARDGRSNAEIGAELFLSVRTVEWHLRKVFGKLSITSRRELRDALPDTSGLPLRA